MKKLLTERKLQGGRERAGESLLRVFSPLFFMNLWPCSLIRPWMSTCHMPPNTSEAVNLLNGATIRSVSCSLFFFFSPGCYDLLENWFALVLEPFYFEGAAVRMCNWQSVVFCFLLFFALKQVRFSAAGPDDGFNPLCTVGGSSCRGRQTAGAESRRGFSGDDTGMLQ